MTDTEERRKKRLAAVCNTINERAEAGYYNVSGRVNLVELKKRCDD